MWGESRAHTGSLGSGLCPTTGVSHVTVRELHSRYQSMAFVPWGGPQCSACVPELFLRNKVNFFPT